MRSNQLFKVICLCVLFGLGQTGCLKDDGETIALPTPLSVEGIPSDYSASPNPTIVSPNAAIPNFQVETTANEGSLLVARLDMTGIMNPNTHEWIDLYGTSYENQNIWMSLDGTPKGIMVKNHTDDETVSRKFDLVFLVDNSGSMNQESDALARDIIDWANSLENSNIDIKFGCIGYAEDG